MKKTALAAVAVLAVTAGSMNAYAQDALNQPSNAVQALQIVTGAQPSSASFGFALVSLRRFVCAGGGSRLHFGADGGARCRSGMDAARDRGRDAAHDRRLCDHRDC